MSKIFGQTAGDEVIVVRVDDDGHLQVDTLSIAAGSNLIGRVDARDGDKIWSFGGIVEEEVENTDLDDGNNFITGSIIPSGEIWVIARCSFLTDSASATRIQMYASGVAVAQYLFDEMYNNDGLWRVAKGPIYMQENDYFRARIFNATAGDEGLLRYSGYKMQI